MRIRAIAALVGIVVVLGLAGPAFASVSYGSEAAPIKAESNSSDGNAWFYGTVSVASQSWLRNHYSFRDSAPGGNRAYVTTDWYFWRPGCVSGANCWDYDSADRSSETRSGAWIAEDDYVDLSPVADRGRAMTRVCENQNNSPDACSNYVYATLSY